ncbi:MAG: ribonuclease Z [Candidatus Methanofastidiosa archaeon]|nr:ribonuclease Z [Candidatus Methanofastidiosa archaeon]
MKVVFLGTGASKPSPDRNVSSLAVIKGPEVLLFDCGEGTQRQMLRSVRQSRLTRVFLTHFHGDHYLGLPGLLMTLSLQGRTRALEVYGPEGTASFVSHLLHSGYMELSFELMVGELSSSVVRGSSYSVHSFPVNHGVPALGYIIIEDDRRGRFDTKKAAALGISGQCYAALERDGTVEVNGNVIALSDVTGAVRKGKKVTYSGDTAPVVFPPEAMDTDLLIHEATFLSEKDRADTYHSTVDDAVTAARAIRAHRLVLTHINARYTEEEFAEAVSSYPEDLVVAQDHLVLEI